MNTDQKKKTILLVNDNELVLNGLIRVLETSFDFEQITGFSNAKQACYEIKKQKYDLFIIDLQLKEISGFDLITFIRSVQPHASVIVVTKHEEVWTINRMLEMEVDGIVLKSSPTEHILQAVRSVLKGNRYLCPRFNHLKNQFRHKHTSQMKQVRLLTEQEKIILRYIVEGLSSREIAETLSLSENTIESHRKNLFVKLDVRNVAQLVAVALQNGIVNDD